MADLVLTGRIIQKLPLVDGVSKAGNAWRKQEYVLETTDNYPKKVCFNFFGDRIDQNQLEVGDFVNLSFDIESREYNGRWYTDVRGWRAEKTQPGMPPQQQAAAMGPAPQNFGPMPQPQADNGLAAAESPDDLPF
ncbi:MAG: DUF3127 domain-containing protein [Prevotella sp.]|nr:DUF3127 domain-containing protein [Prevotella sp.]CDE09462.1 putative uncharacterized protein [Prevotella sp. CAG:485]